MHLNSSVIVTQDGPADQECSFDAQPSMLLEFRELQEIISNSNKHRSSEKQPEFDQDPNSKRAELAKLKYRKLKQKLLSLSYKHDDLTLGKEVASSNKPRLMKLSIELDRQVNNQVKDFIAIENIMKEFLKLVEQKKQNDLHILRQSKFVPSTMELFKKILSSHKNEYKDSLKVIEIANKVLLHFVSITLNREYLILTNRLQTLVGLLKWCLNKRQEIPDLYDLKLLNNLFSLINSLIEHKQQGDSHLLIQETIELIFYSQCIKKVRYLIESLMTEDGPIQESIIKGALRLFASIFSQIATEHTKTMDDCQPTASWNCITNTQYVSSFITSFTFMLLFDKQKNLRQEYLPQSYLSMLLFVLKYLNSTSKICPVTNQKCLNEEFVMVLSFVIDYCNKHFEESTNVRQLLNQTIILLGYLALDNIEAQDRFRHHKLTIKLCELPTKYIMDKRYVEVLMPTLCCMVNNNDANLQQIFQQISQQLVVKFLRTELQTTAEDKSLHGRKFSMSSLNSINTQCSTNIFVESRQSTLKQRFPVRYWEPLLHRLEQID